METYEKLITDCFTQSAQHIEFHKIIFGGKFIEYIL